MVVNCVAYHRGQKLADIPLTEVRTHLERRDCFVWVALKDPEADELAALQQEFALHELAIEDAQKGHQRPKIEEYGSSLFVVMHLIEPVGTELQTGEVAIFVGPQYIVSVRRDAQVGFTEVRRRCELWRASRQLAAGHHHALQEPREPRRPRESRIAVGHERHYLLARGEHGRAAVGAGARVA